MENILSKIEELKKRKNAVILAHYYQPMEIQLAADIVGDSLELARKSRDTKADILVFCGVTFMGESAKLLCPDKKVLLPAPNAGCAMADTVSERDVLDLKAAHPDSAVVCYINSTAATKALCDICCTSANAVRVVKGLKEDSVIFVPDKNLGDYVAEQAPEKRFFIHEGCCYVHDSLSLAAVAEAKARYPRAAVLVHPECKSEVRKAADFIGSTTQIINYCESSPLDEFIICTETGVTERLRYLLPDKRFYVPEGKALFCRAMKLITLEGLLKTLEEESGEVLIDPALREKALLPITRMLELG